jgi:hypothetical protein
MLALTFENKRTLSKSVVEYQQQDADLQLQIGHPKCNCISDFDAGLLGRG